VRAFPGGHAAAVAGALIGPGRETGVHAYILDLDSAKARRLLPPTEDDSTLVNLAVARDGRTVWIGRVIGNALRITAVSPDGRVLIPAALTLTNVPYTMDTGPDGSIYVDQVDRPASLVRFAPEGGTGKALAATQNLLGETFAILPDGRAAIT